MHSRKWEIVALNSGPSAWCECHRAGVETKTYAHFLWFLRGLNNTNLSSYSYGRKFQMGRIRQGWFLLEKKNLFPGLFQLLEAPTFFALWPLHCHPCPTPIPQGWAASSPVFLGPGRLSQIMLFLCSKAAKSSQWHTRPLLIALLPPPTPTLPSTYSAQGTLAFLLFHEAARLSCLRAFACAVLCVWNVRSSP